MSARLYITLTPPPPQKVLYRQFDESFIRIMVRCQQHGALRVLQDDPQLVDTLEPWQLDLLLMGRINLTIHEGHGLPIGRKMLVLSKKTYDPRGEGAKGEGACECVLCCASCMLMLKMMVF